MEYFITANKIPVHISDSGEKGGETLLFLHGYMETFYIWEEFVQLFPEHYRIIMIDLPGHGLTSYCPTGNSMEFCADVCKDILDKCGVDKCTIIGHSLGGYISQNFLKRYPQKVSRLINISSNPYPDTPEVRSKRDREIQFIVGGKHITLAQIVIPNMYYKPNLRKFDDKIAETIELCETHDPQGLAAAVKGMMMREDNVEFLSHVNIPVLFIHGDNDQYFPVEYVYQMQKALPNCKIEIIPETGHCSFIENATKVYEKIIEFITL